MLATMSFGVLVGCAVAGLLLCSRGGPPERRRVSIASAAAVVRRNRRLRDLTLNLAAAAPPPAAFETVGDRHRNTALSALRHRDSASWNDLSACALASMNETMAAAVDQLAPFVGLVRDQLTGGDARWVITMT